MSSVGTAVFTAIGNFGSLISQSNRAADALDDVADSAHDVDGSIPASGGSTSAGLGSISAAAQAAIDGLQDLTEQLLTLPDGNANVDVDDGSARARLTELTNRLRELGAQAAEVLVTADTGQARAAVTRAMAGVRAKGDNLSLIHI